MWRCRFDVKMALDWKDKAKKKNSRQRSCGVGFLAVSPAPSPQPPFWGDRATLRAVNDSEQGRCGGRHMSRPLIYHTAGRRPFSVSCNRATARTWPLTGRRANSHTQDRTDFTSRRRTLAVAEHRAFVRAAGCPTPCARGRPPCSDVRLQVKPVLSNHRRRRIFRVPQSCSFAVAGGARQSLCLSVGDSRKRRWRSVVVVLVGLGASSSELSIVKRTPHSKL